MAYNSCRINEAQKSVLKYKPNHKHKHLLLETYSSLLINQKNIIVYITLNNDEGFWFYINEYSGTRINGCEKQDEHWVHRVIELSDIRCFF